MARQAIGPNRYVEIPTAQELAGPLSDVVKRGFADYAALEHVEYPSPKVQIQADSGGFLTTGGVSGINTGLGPKSGFIWDVKRIVIASNAGIPAAALVFLYINGAQIGDLVDASLLSTLGAVVLKYSSQQFVMMGDAQLWLSGSAFTANEFVSVSMQVKEVAVNKIGRLNL